MIFTGASSMRITFTGIVHLQRAFLTGIIQGLPQSIGLNDLTLPVRALGAIDRECRRRLEKSGDGQAPVPVAAAPSRILMHDINLKRVFGILSSSPQKPSYPFQPFRQPGSCPRPAAAERSPFDSRTHRYLP